MLFLLQLEYKKAGFKVPPYTAHFLSSLFGFRKTNLLVSILFIIMGPIHGLKSLKIAMVQSLEPVYLIRFCLFTFPLSEHFHFIIFYFIYLICERRKYTPILSLTLKVLGVSQVSCTCVHIDELREANNELPSLIQYVDQPLSSIFTVKPHTAEKKADRDVESMEVDGVVEAVVEVNFYFTYSFNMLFCLVSLLLRFVV